MKPTSASAAREALQAGYPDGDVEVRREFGGGLRASVHGDGGMAFFSLGDTPGVLSAALGICPEGDPGGGGPRAVVAAGEGTEAAA